MSRDAYDEDKTTELILYIAVQTEEDPTAGATKLNKILYFSERSHLHRYGKPIVDADYQKLPQGPGLRRMLPIIDRLERAGDARLVERDYFGNTQKRLLALRDPDLSMFAAEEIASVDRIIRQFWGQTAKMTSELSHEDAGWLAVEEGQSIPLSMAFIGEPEVTEHMRMPARELANESS